MVEGSWMFIASSPPEDPSHWFYQLRESKSDEYKNVDFENICEDCKKLSMEQMSKCNHVVMKQSLLKDGKKRKRLTEGLNMSMEKNLRENAGVLIPPNYCAFKKEHIERLFQLDYVTKGYQNVEFYMCCIDPNGGGSNDTAIIFGAVIQGKYSLLWANFRNTNVDFVPFILDELHQFHKKIRKDIKIPIIVALEAVSNYNGEFASQNVEHRAISIDSCKNVHFIKDNEHKAENGTALCGVRLDQYRKRDMLTMLQCDIEGKNFLLHEDISTSNERGIAFVKSEMESQFKRWKNYETCTSLKRNGNKKVKTNTGKAGLLNDDLVLVILMFAYWHRAFTTRDNYASQYTKYVPNRIKSW